MRNAVPSSYRSLLACLLLAGCADGAALTETPAAFDQAGNRYPPACMRDLNDVAVPIDFVSRETLARFHGPINGYPVVGWYTFDPPHIYIWRGLTGERLVDAVRHERCHAVAGEWHE